ncbi:hypothetical protein HIM_01351 [Hirsutella minnesotensis 3608]|nr:hypothetical protein HIM_01351 [Hirsutella minnesotensis 3608]
MPIFQADLDHDRAPATSPRLSAPIDIEPPASPRLVRLAQESLPAELCEGPVPDVPVRADDDTATSDRSELIERLKRGESPTWIPNRHFGSILHHGSNVDSQGLPCSPSHSPRLLPPAQITPERNGQAQGYVDERLLDGLSIERPRSALHTGDFTHDNRPERTRPSQGDPKADARACMAAPSPWITTSPPRDFDSFFFETNIQKPKRTERSQSAASPLSSSLSSSFVYQPPTSPLVQSESNDELEFSMRTHCFDLSIPGQGHGAHALLSSHLASPLASPQPCMPSAWAQQQRRHASLPYQAHQPRRSLTSTPSFALHGTSPQTPALLRSRRPSLCSDASPIQHASMVGSYEESILRGRMSTTPSKPFDFLAQIGVLARGKCKSSLRCPAHVTLPFSAVYYSYSSTPHGRSRSDDGPSPYVGQVDLENGLPNPEEESRLKRKAQSRHTEKRSAEVDGDAMTGSELDADRRRAARSRRRSGSPKAPPGGSYRIPEKGQIQIIIKNQNKTAVKLFLVPYDLTGMEPGTKTFIRQRSYSAGPIIDHVPNMSERDSLSRPMLRYLVHLHICCPSKGRFYLYKSIRVVFANRVPEGKEKLRNETTWPEPRFTPYKPIRVMPPPPPASSAAGPAAMLAVDKAMRRRSLGVSFGASSTRLFDPLDGLEAASAHPNGDTCASAGSGNTLPLDPVPFRLPPPRECGDSDLSASTSAMGSGVMSPESSQASRPSTRDRGQAGLGHWGAAQYEKLSKGDFGYGGNAFTGLSGNGAAGGAPEGLLSQRLRSLGVKPRPPQDRGNK